MKVIAFAASNSQNSINKRLASYAAGLIQGAEVEVLDLNDYELPLFSEDKEKELADMATEYRENFDEEFETNQMVIKQFKSTEHLTTDETGTAAPADEGGE